MNKTALDQAKSRFNRALAAMAGVMLSERGTQQADCGAWQNLYYAQPSASHAQKQLDRLLSEYVQQAGEASAALTNAVNEARSAAAEVISQKAAYEQAKAQKKAARADVAAKRLAPPVIVKDATANAQVVAAVTEVGNGFKARIKEQFSDQYRSVIQHWKQKCQDNPGKTSPSTFWSYNGEDRSVCAFNQYMRSTLSMFLRTEIRPASELATESGPAWKVEQHRYYLRDEDEVARIIDTYAEKHATEAIQGFVYKMCSKLGAILDAKGGFDHVEVTGTLCQNTMHFFFSNGDYFAMVNDITLNQSCLGTVFNQYPTRFSKVTLAGNTVKGISEAWMKRNFKADRVIKLGGPVVGTNLPLSQAPGEVQ